MEKRLVRIAAALLDMKPPETPGRNAGDSVCAGAVRYEVSQAAINAVNDLLSEGGTDTATGSDKLRESISKYASIPRENIRCFPSPEAAIETLARTYLEHGAEAVISSPGRGAFAAAQAVGARVSYVDHENPFDPQIEAVINYIGPRTRVVFIENSNRTTGATFSEAEIVFLLAYAEATMVVVDERHFEHGGRTVADLVKRFPNLTVIRSVSEIFGMGPLCMGYALSDPENLQYLDRIMPADPNARLSYAAAAAALGDSSCLKRNRAAIEHARALFARHLPEIGYVFQAPPTDFLLLKVADIDFAMRLFADSGIRGENLSRFEHLENYIRVEIGTPESAELLLMELSLAAGHLATGFNRNRMADMPRVLSDAGRILAKTQ